MTPRTMSCKRSWSDHLALGVEAVLDATLDSMWSVEPRWMSCYAVHVIVWFLRP